MSTLCKDFPSQTCAQAQAIKKSNSFMLPIQRNKTATNYAERIKGLREDADKSQAEIANLLGTTQQYYGKYEAGKRPLPLDRLFILCEYYHVSADYILGLPDGLPYGHSKTRDAK